MFIEDLKEDTEVSSTSVHSANYGRTLVCKLDFESDLLDSIREIAEKNGLESAIFSAIGAVKNAVVSFYDQNLKRYRELTLNEPLEVLICSGNIAKLQGETLVHAHIVLSDVEGKAYGGHLMRGTKIFAMEVVVTELKGIELLREFDPVTGLNLIRLP